MTFLGALFYFGLGVVSTVLIVAGSLSWLLDRSEVDDCDESALTELAQAWDDLEQLREIARMALSDDALRSATGAELLAGFADTGEVPL